jgi:hypothetical protein
MSSQAFSNIVRYNAEYLLDQEGFSTVVRYNLAYNNPESFSNVVLFQANYPPIRGEVIVGSTVRGEVITGSTVNGEVE